MGAGTARVQNGALYRCRQDGTTSATMGLTRPTAGRCGLEGVTQRCRRPRHGELEAGPR